MIITRRYYSHDFQGNGCTIDVRTDSRVSESQARMNAEELAHRKLKAKSLSVAPIDISSQVTADYSIGPRPKPYTVKKKNGKFWVMTPSGKAIAVAHRTKADANMAANVLNHMNRDESTVVTVEQRRARNLQKPIFVIVQGGVAEVVDSTVPKGFEVQIIDYDNLTEGGFDAFHSLSQQAREYVLADDPDFQLKYEDADKDK